MKAVILGVAGAFAFVGAAAAESTVVNIAGQAEAKCSITSGPSNINIGEVINENARVRNNLANRIANELNGLNLKAWCNGNNNTVNAYRTFLTTDDGQLDNGFAQAIGWDVNMDIEDATRPDGTKPIEGTSDGPGASPVNVTRFGPTGAGAKVTFTANDTFASGFGSNAAPVVAAPGDTTRSDVVTRVDENTRVAAGDYNAQLTIQLTPGT